MRAGDVEVIVLDRDRGDDGVDQGTSPRPVGRMGQLHTDQQLGNRDRGDGDVVLISD
jgi:hypothetical protein